MKIREMLFLAATVATSSLIGAEVRAADQELTPVCSAPNKSGGYVLDLGEYRGIYVMYGPKNQRYGCPAHRSCTCDLLPGQIPNGPWKLAFTGAGDSTLAKPFVVDLEFENGVLKKFKPTHPQFISLWKNRLKLSSRALRHVHFAKGNKSGWAMEYWDLAKKEMDEAWRRDQVYKTRLIVDVPNNIFGPDGRGLLTVSARPAGFSELPKFLERDPRYPRGVRHK